MSDLIPIFMLYMIPTWIAMSRAHQSWGAILALNLLTGWTGLGWIASLVWSLTHVPKKSADNA